MSNIHHHLNYHLGAFRLVSLFFAALALIVRVYAKGRRKKKD